MSVLKWMGVALAGLVALVVLVLGISWALPIPAAQREALEAMEAPQAARPPQANAFAAVWLLPYDGVHPAQWEALVAEDVARFRQQEVASGAGTSVAEGRFAKVTRDANWCRRGEPCLAQVRAHADEVAVAHRGHEGLHERIAALSAYTYYRSAYDPEPSVPIPEMAILLERTPVHALAHVRGDSTNALQGLCEDVVAARMLMRTSEDLQVAMAGGRWAEQGADLFTSILSELPEAVGVPAICSAAFAPPATSELDLCRAMRSEFSFQSMAIMRMPPPGSLFLSQRKTRALSAWQLSRVCTSQAHLLIERDQPMQLQSPSGSWRFHCLTNISGCLLMDIQRPAYDSTSLIMQDVGAQLRIAGAMLWLRRQPQGDRRAMQVLAGLPAAFGSAQRPLRACKQGACVQVSRFAPPDGSVGRVISAPLPFGWGVK